MIVGLGTDILETNRMDALIAKGGNSFLERWFTAEEIGYCRSKARPVLHFAARMSAKEAVAKALRVEKNMPLSWKDIGIVRDETGAPHVVLTGLPAQRARDLGVASILLSMSHTEEYATATAVAVGSVSD